MRRSTCAVLLLLSAACGKKAPDTDEPVDGFRPPVTISRSDFGGTLDTRFNRLDRDRSGAITGDELTGRRGSRVASMDRDGDGKVTRAEFVQGSLAQFDADDLNHDGNVTSDERRLARERRQGAGSSPTP